MKSAKRVFSVILVLTMLLTFASFPAIADTYTYQPKTVYLEAGHNNKGGYSGPYLLARPTNNMYVGDKLALPDEGQQMFIPVLQNGGANIKGFILAFGTTPYEVSSWYSQSNKVYVAINENGVMTGFYPTLADMNASTNKTSIELNKQGKWLFAIETLITSTNGEYSMNSPQGSGSLGNVWNPLRWTLDVKETPTFDPTVSVPKVEENVKATSKSILASLITDTTAFVDDIGQNQAYVMDVGRSEAGVDISPDSIAGYGTAQYETLKAQLGVAVVAPVEGVRIDFDKTAYVKDIKLNAGMNYLLYDVFGSLNGENWFLISKDNTATSNEFTVNVDSALKHLRVDYRDYNDHWGKITTSLTAVNGVLNVFPEETYTVTFKHVVSEDGEAQLDDATATTDVNGVYSVPSPFDSGDYEFYANASCTVKFDVNEKVVANTVVYVRLATANPDPDIDGVVKVYAADYPRGYCGINFIERPLNDIYVGDKLVISPVAKYTTVPTLSEKAITKVRFLYGANGQAPKNAYVKIDTTTGGLTGFYSDFACTVPLEITFDTVGKWMFYLYDWYDSDDQPMCTSYTNFNYVSYNQCREMFFLDVKEANTPVATAPSVHPGVLANVRDILSTFDQTVTSSATNNVIYFEGTSVAGSSESKFILTPDQRTLLSNSETRMSYEAIRLDFTSKTYVKELTITKNGYPSAYFKYNVFGSVDGENWYLISKNNETTQSVFKVKVNTVVKYLRIEQVAGYYHWGKTNNVYSLTAISGYEDVDNTWRVTYPENIINVNALSDENGVITMPTTFKTSDYANATSINAVAMIYKSDELKFVIPKEAFDNIKVPLGIEIFDSKITLPMALLEELAKLNSDITLKAEELNGSIYFGLYNGESEIVPQNKARVMIYTNVNEPAVVLTTSDLPITDSGVINGNPVGYVALPAAVWYSSHNYTVYEDAMSSDESIYIKFALARGILDGITDFEFAPNVEVTRWMLYSALLGTDYDLYVSYPNFSFTDVVHSAPYAKAVQFAYENGFVTSSTFKPAEKVSKDEIANVLYKFAVDFKGVDFALYSDAADYCTKNGIMNNVTSSTITRAEFAKVMAKFLNAYNTIDEINYDNYSDIEFDEENIVLSFAAMSDVHIDDTEYKAAAKNYENALKIAYEMTNDNLDLVFIAGDLTQNLMYADKADSRLFEIDGFKKFSDLYIKDGTGFVFTTGNHDRQGNKSYEDKFYEAFTATAEDVEKYYSYDVVEDCEYDKGNRHAVVNGYHFLSVGMYQNYISYLQPILDELVAEDPNKPIFVQYHFHAADTVYETHYADTAQDASIRKFLDNYPQVVYFSGHTHNALENSRAIWQGTFTAIDTASVRYLDDNSFINYSVKIPVNATHADAYEAAAESTLVEVDKNNNIRFTSYNVHRGDVVAQYVISAPKDDNSHLITYSNDRETYSAAPVFCDNTDFKLTKTDAGNVDVFFDAAMHDDIVWYYTITFSADGEEDQTFYFTSRYFDLEGMPDEISCTLYKDSNTDSYHRGLGHNLTEGKVYEATLTAYDVWDHASETITINYKH